MFVDELLAAHLFSHLCHFVGALYCVDTSLEVVFQEVASGSASGLHLGFDDEFAIVVGAELPCHCEGLFGIVGYVAQWNTHSVTKHDLGSMVLMQNHTSALENTHQVWSRWLQWYSIEQVFQH